MFYIILKRQGFFVKWRIDPGGIYLNAATATLLFLPLLSYTSQYAKACCKPLHLFELPLQAFIMPGLNQLALECIVLG